MTAREFAFVTSNRGKFLEAAAILRPYGLRLRWSRRTLPEPQADTLEHVARAKLAAASARRSAVLVEDSGLFIDALQGFPGVYSSYVFRTIGLDGILALLHGQRREATFRTVAGVRLGRRVVLALGETRGAIATERRGTSGFGYDPIFVPIGEPRSFAELTLEEKNLYSHRGRALRALAGKLARRPI